MNFKTVFLLLILTFGCSDDHKTDEYLLKEDQKTLIKSLDSDKVFFYKFMKIVLRSSASKDSIFYPHEANKFKVENLKKLQAFNQKVNNTLNDSKNKNLSVLQYITLYKEYRKIKGIIEKTDEDIFPTLHETFGVTYQGSPNLTSNERNEINAYEHALLSILVLFSKELGLSIGKKLGKDISLYECSKTQPRFLPDNEFKPVMQFFRAFAFYKEALFYLSEDEITRNLKWLEDHEKLDLPNIQSLFGWNNLNNMQTHFAFRAANHLFRALCRTMMDREIDEKRALEDYESFLVNSKKAGFDNEIIWSVETYLYLKREDSQKAILALHKLEDSEFLSIEDRKNIKESIEYLQRREPEKILNEWHDRYFLSKIASRYAYAILSKVDWKKVLEDNNIPHLNAIFNNFSILSDAIGHWKKYTGLEQLEKNKEKVKGMTKDLWDKAKDLVKEN